MSFAPRLSAADKLATVELYFELQNTHKVAEELGISRHSVMQRLTALGINTRENRGSLPAEHYNDMKDVELMKATFRELIEQEKK